MSFQWTVVAAFLYAEIAIVILLLLPFIGPKIWQNFFKFRYMSRIRWQINLFFMAFVVILFILFIDSIREMSKYATEKEHSNHSHSRSYNSSYAKLFRAQRNFYITGFALFLCPVIYRLAELLDIQTSEHLADESEDKDLELRQLRQELAATKEELIQCQLRQSSVEAESKNVSEVLDEQNESNDEMKKFN